MSSAIEKLDQIRLEGWALNIFIPSGNPTRTHRVMITYDNQGPFKEIVAPTLSEAVDLLWAATRDK